MKKMLKMGKKVKIMIFKKKLLSLKINLSWHKRLEFRKKIFTPVEPNWGFSDPHVSAKS